MAKYILYAIAKALVEARKPEGPGHGRALLRQQEEIWA